ncbi:MAG: HlyD family type I secretion periplasmic adaptor subunit [Kordiimonadaceae bacterium]|nr:HlyD family type I secretion periplasmic adaptor subunit [Kordiimonadaceae bacterium]MBO6569492.1 HlyD family type I secretion periplasmic adaptor subunit [Kordiimonadaceae bacterium]MBO6964967.1 HlyD family type I secretion periplasmic adaptor subunit [Kordiimonadaceae bacterium]
MAESSLTVDREQRQLALANEGFTRDDLGSWHQDLDTDRKPVLKVASLILIVVFGIGGLWSLLAPLASAVVASGRVIAEDRNRVVQHLEGGILEELMVREGDIVDQGAVVARLDDTLLRAQLDADLLQEAILRVQLARRRAEVQLSDSIEFPADFDPLIMDDPRLAEGIESQREEFQSVKSYIAAKIANLQNNIIGQQQDIAGQEEALQAFSTAAELYREELRDFQELDELGYTRKLQINQRKREIAQTDARVANTKINIEKARNNIISLQNQIEQEELAYLKTANETVVQIQQTLNQTQSRIDRLKDMLKRTKIVSPSDGRVFRIAKRALGEVVRPGETIMEIFPSEDALTIEALIQITDIEKVEEGQAVQVVFPSSREKRLIPLPGELVYLSADAVVSESNPAGMYIGHVRLDASANQEDMLPGNFAEVYINTGSRTFAEILAKPFTRFLYRSFKG